MSRFKLIAGAAALALPLLAADLVSDGYDLRPRFEEGQELSIRSEMTMTFGLDDATAQMGEMEMIPEVPTVDIEIEATESMAETILAVRDGKIAKVRRTHGDEGFQVSGEVGMQGNFQDIDESEEGPLAGRTLEVTIDEEGNASTEDVTDDDPDPLEDSVLALVTERTHFEPMLPKGNVEVGGTWNVGDAMMEEITRAMNAATSDDPEAAKLMGVIESLKDSFEFDAKGKLVSVDGDTATIEWKVTAELSIDDLFGIIREVADPEDMGNLPESAEGSLEVAIEMEGTGTFDLGSHQLTEMKMEGEFVLSGEFAVNEQGMDIVASADASGTFEIDAGVTVE
jgi:hypothetical protein